MEFGNAARYNCHQLISLKKSQFQFHILRGIIRYSDNTCTLRQLFFFWSRIFAEEIAWTNIINETEEELQIGKRQKLQKPKLLISEIKFVTRVKSISKFVVKRTTEAKIFEMILSTRWGIHTFNEETTFTLKMII